MEGLGFPREVRADQYGLRFPAIVGGATVRVELIREARVELGPAEAADWTALPLLSIQDAFVEKLLANSDRWADRDELCRDLIDLAVLRGEHGPIPATAWTAAEGAYGTGPLDDLRKAAHRFLSEPPYRARCFDGLQVERDGEVVRGVELLAADVGL